MFFFFNDTATTEIYTLSLHDALPICPTFLYSFAIRPAALADKVQAAGPAVGRRLQRLERRVGALGRRQAGLHGCNCRSEEHTSELQSRQYLVCRLLLEKKNTNHHPSS